MTKPVPVGGTYNSSGKTVRTFRHWILLISVMSATVLLTGYAGGLWSPSLPLAMQPAPLLTLPPSGGLPPQFMGLNPNQAIVSGGTVPWPSFAFGSMELWNTGNPWCNLNPSAGVYNWTNLDAWLDKAASEGMTDIIYGFGKTPQWASSNPNDLTCSGGALHPGSCDPPNDVNKDGTGTDQHWKDFVTAIVNHAAGRIQYWEMWNEPNFGREWNGTDAQLVRMSEDAYNIIKSLDPTSLITTPSPAGGLLNQGSDWMSGYFAAGGAPYAEVLTFHGYIQMHGYEPPEDEVPIILAYKNLLRQYGVSSLPLWDTQASWGLNTNLPDPDMEAAFLARMYILSREYTVQRFYWFQYGASNFGTIWTPTGGLNTAGIAYTQIYNWLVGTINDGPCVASGTVYTCGFKATGNLQEQAVWDTAQTCSNGICTTSNFTPNPIYIKYLDLAGNVTPISPPGSQIKIGAKPILLEN